MHGIFMTCCKQHLTAQNKKYAEYMFSVSVSLRWKLDKFDTYRVPDPNT